MDKNKKLIKDTVIYGISTFGSKLINFILLPLYTNYFTSSEYGKWDLITTTVTLLIPFISFELTNAVYRWLLEEEDLDKKKEIISTNFIYIIRNLIAFSFLGIILINFIKIPHFSLILLMINLDILSDFVKKCLRGFGYNKQFALMGIIQTVVTLLTNIFCIFVLKMRIETFFVGSITGSASVLVIGWYILRLHKYLSIYKYSKKSISSFLKYSIPMIPGAISWWVMNASDRYLINIFLGLSANGIYAVANKFPSIIVMISSVFQLAWRDNAILNFKNKDRDKYYTVIFKQYFRLMTTSCMIFISVTPIIMQFIIASNFYIAWKYTGLLYVAAIFSAFASFWGAAYHGSKNTDIILKTTLIGAAINFLVNIVLIKFIGLYAAAISSVLAYLIMWITRIFNKSNVFKITIDKKDFAILNIGIILNLIMSFIGNNIINILMTFISMAIFIIYNKNLLQTLFQSAKDAINKKLNERSKIV